MNLLTYKLLPRKLLSQLMYKIARIKQPTVKNAIIWSYQKITKANTDFAAEKNPYAYPTLNAFFTRALAPNERPIDTDTQCIVSPVDGRCAIFGDITKGKLYQAKTQSYTLSALLNSHQQAEKYEGGKAVTLYLAPDDYHRIHMPCDGKLTAMSFCPGDKHSVALDLLEKIPNIFSANERLVCHFETEFGAMALIMVGALNVSSIETVWQGEMKDNGDNHYQYNPPLNFRKGEEIGRFNLGSTVILCFANLKIDFSNPKLSSGDKIHMGEYIANCEEKNYSH
ncbi:Phosphatidylserine decarboxylase proenzyme [Suttonella ornithocola]|uniref:Phosphatidylserine decarboxylase proenzyme n=2 Tax=Suttonella ornithocola TaxID=279832 RepID=A0A380MV95_9GAMM|nr:Phosphatidylserine decarboxylase proenzyme [Suttonella ornithocola]